MNCNRNEIKIKLQEIYLLKYKTNQCDDIKYKAFESLELATLFHLSFKKIATEIGYPEKEIIHYEILVIPFNLDASRMLKQIKKTN